MPTTPLLSIVTITRADPAGLARTLASTAAIRAHPTVEQLVIDGGSGTAAQKVFPPVRYIARTPQGIADACNAGLTAATGEWLWFIHGGDAIDERLSWDFLAALLNSSRSDVIIGGTTYAGEAEPKPFLPPKMQWPPFRSWIQHPSALVRRHLFSRFGGFDTGFQIAFDYEWWLRALSRDVPVDLVALPFARFAIGGVSTQPAHQRRMHAEIRQALWRHKYVLLRSWTGFTRRLFADLSRSAL